EDSAKLPRYVGVFTGVVPCTLDRDLVIRHGVFPLAAELLEARHPMVEEFEGEQIQAVRASPRIEHIAGDHRIEIETTQVDPGTPKGVGVVLAVVRGLANRRVLE